ncbi:hypothetical protein [Glycomyces sp. YM15]|uniref:hypothetical protein n=1 Tax=Glycomyces sp. YM15 TaxID=2800446 RepID=UPI001965EA1E|nr:hypothetical protein [Glycomyces sp. YM15]
MRINPDLQARVARAAYAAAEACDWASLSDRERSDMYAKWLEDPEIGLPLREFTEPEKARVWLKDGPMKEYARARFGVGQWAQYLPDGARQGADTLVHKSLGPNWKVEPGSRQIKPLRVKLLAGDFEEVIFTWSIAKDFKHLVWAALKAQATDDRLDWILCAVGTETAPIPDDEKAFHHRVAERCGLRVVHVEV